ncbi:MAG TPA: cellulose synthase [Streptosporangiaceae bacterium]
MNSWLSFATSSWAGPVFLLVTIVGLVLSVITWRKKGARSGIRGIAWSLLPLAAWLTHALGLIGRIVSAIVQFAGAFVFSPTTYLGVIVVAVSALLFLVSGGIPLVRWRKRHKSGRGDGRSGGGKPATSSVPAVSAKSGPSARGKAAVPADQDDDLSDVRDILKRHGIS